MRRSGCWPGEAEPTREGDYGDLLRMARSVLLRPALYGGGGEWGGGVDSDGGVDERGTDVGASDGDEETRDGDDETMWDGYPTGGTDAAGSRAALAHSVGAVWSEAVVSGPPEVRGACVGLLAAVLPRVAATTRGDGPGVCASVGADVAAGWLRPYARLLWELKHGDPGTTSRALRTLHAVAARCSGEGGDSGDESPLAAALAAVETELAPFFARVPPPASTDQTAPRRRGKPGPFSKLPAACQHVAIALLGQLPRLSPTTLRAAAHAALNEDADPNIAVRAAEAMTCNMRAAPLALSVSFLSALLTGPVTASEGTLLARRQLLFLSAVYLSSVAALPLLLLSASSIAGIWYTFAAFQFFRFSSQGGGHGRDPAFWPARRRRRGLGTRGGP